MAAMPGSNRLPNPRPTLRQVCSPRKLCRNSEWSAGIRNPFKTFVSMKLTARAFSVEPFSDGVDFPPARLPARRRGGPEPKTIQRVRVCENSLIDRELVPCLVDAFGKRPSESGAPGQAAIVRERRAARLLACSGLRRLSFASPTARCGSRPAGLQNSAAWSTKAAGWQETNSSYRFSASARHWSASAALPSSSSMRANWAA